MKQKKREKVKRHRRKPTAFQEMMKDLAVDIISGVISGVIAAIVIKLLKL